MFLDVHPPKFPSLPKLGKDPSLAFLATEAFIVNDLRSTNLLPVPDCQGRIELIPSLTGHDDGFAVGDEAGFFQCLDGPVPKVADRIRNTILSAFEVQIVSDFLSRKPTRPAVGPRLVQKFQDPPDHSVVGFAHLHASQLRPALEEGEFSLVERNRFGRGNWLAVRLGAGGLLRRKVPANWQEAFSGEGFAGSSFEVGLKGDGVGLFAKAA